MNKRNASYIGIMVLFILIIPFIYTSTTQSKPIKNQQQTTIQNIEWGNGIAMDDKVSW